MNEKTDPNKFKELLDGQYEWPSNYMFKFIVAAHDLNSLMNILENHAQVSHRESKTGKYISVTSTKKVSSSDEVIQIYQETSTIQSVITL